jgi:hypothetical protein
MRTHTIVVVALLGLQLARPALAQTSGWDFSSKASAVKDTAAPKETSASKETAVAKRAAWGFAEARPADAVKAPAEKPAQTAHAATPAPSHAVTPASPKSAPVIPRGGVVLQWSTASAVRASAPDVKPEADLKADPAVNAEPDAKPNVKADVKAEAAAAAPKAAAPAVAQAAKPVEVRRPQPTGLERLSDDWPKAVKVGVQYRGRAEEQRGSAATNGRDDGYYLNRIRLEATVNIAPWLKGYAQVQDAQTLGYNVAAQPTSLTNTFDLRQGYVEARWPSANGFGVRVGRQEINLGEQRLVGSSEWTTARSFDAVRVFVTQPGVQVDAFVSSVVVLQQNAFDRWKPGETFSGTYVSLSRLVPKGVIEPYVLARLQNSVTGELGSVGDGATYTFGARALGALPRRFDYGVEVAAQRGHISTDAIAAWAGHYALGWTLAPSALKPRLVAEFNHASGDDNPSDGRRRTFDQLYPTNHNKYGLGDQMGWRNMRDAMVGFELLPVAKLKLSANAHRLFLATTADGLYTAGGVQKVLNRQATSRTVGTELDLQAVYAFSKELSLGAGVGTLFAGDYLAQSTSTGTLWTPYVMWNIKF